MNVRADGQLIFNTSSQMLTAALDGLCIAFPPEDEFSPHIAEGRLLRVLQG